MKGSIVKVSIFIISVMISLSACSSKKESLSEYEYQRSNAASEKALDRLDRE
jgi:outer membrane protein assembly factor BamE (lipoprotein component of BamABCDE complex)